MSALPVLELRSIVKSFGSVQALRGADFVLASGAVHALLGENGAGKSTLLHVAFGMIKPDSGSIRVRGSAVALRSPVGARALGLGMVHQHFTSIGSFTVAENIALAMGRTGGRVDSRTVGELMRGLDPAARVESLGVALRQRLEIVKALASGARTLLLDEPSAVLAPSEVEELLALVKQFSREGGAVALITHKLPEVFAAADRVTVLREGRVVLSAPVEGQTVESLARAMIGGSASRDAGRGAGVGRAATDPKPLVRIGDIGIRSGEIIGVAAIEGNGQREILRTIAGIADADAATSGVSVDGTVGFVPEDRSSEGLIPEMSLTENVVLGLPGDVRWTRGSQLDWPAAQAHTARLIESFGIRAAGPDVRAAMLSGGNQQKLILARVLESGPRVLVAVNPTRGLDFRATEQVHERLRRAAQTGIAVIFYSTDLDEVLELGERVLVVHAGQVREAPRSGDRRVVGEMMLGLPTA